MALNNLHWAEIPGYVLRILEIDGHLRLLDFSSAQR